MAALGFPVFAGGMTLTKDDLNTLREFLDVQDSVLGRLLGFGVACGLEGTVAEGALRVSPGLAVDQNGRGLVVDEEVVLPLTAPAQAFPFVDAAAGGLTAVLVLQEQDQAAPECGDESCDPHAPLRLRSAQVVLATGRLRSPLAEFTTDVLLTLLPLTATATGGVAGEFDRVRDTVLARLVELGVAAARRRTLEGLRLSGVQAVQVYKAAYLNQVLFATVELARCRALRRASCVETTAEPGVALGWVAATTTTWDGRSRHAFAPSEGLTLSLLGGTGGDPCSLALGRLHSVLDGYVEPVPPAAGGGGPKFDVCLPTRAGQRLYRYDPCRLTILERLPEHVFDDYLVLPEHGFFDPQRDPRPEWAAVELDTFSAGTLSLQPGIGHRADDVRAGLVQVLGQHVPSPDVRIVGQDAVDGLEGFTPEVSAAVGDTVVLVTDAGGTVVGTGRVPIGYALRTVGTTVQSASADAARAVQVATALQGSVGAQIAAEVGAVRQEVAAVRQDVTTAFEVRLADVSAPLAQVRSTVAELAERAGRLETRQGALLADVASIDRQTQVLGTRVDNVLLGGVKGRPVGLQGVADAGPTLSAQEVVTVVDSLKAAVASAATARQKEAVDRDLAAVDTALAPLVAAGAEPLVQVEGQALIGVLQGLTEAARAAGANETRLRAVEVDLQGLRGRFR